MKKILFIIAILLQVVGVSAKGDILTVTKPGVVIDYRMDATYGKRVFVKHLRITTSAVRESNGTLDITQIMEYLDKKKKPQKGMGIADGIQSSFTVQEDGSYYMQDTGYGIGRELVRNGFKLRIPKTLKVGDMLECGRSYGSYKWLHHNMEFDVTYSEFKVVAEESIETSAGTFKCFKITGKAVGKTGGNVAVNDDQTLWIAPSIGLVKMEYNNPTIKSIVVIDSITGM